MLDDDYGTVGGEGKAPGLLSRIAQGVRARFARGSAAAPAVPEALDPRLTPFADKVTTAESAVGCIPGGSHVFVGTACATPRTLVHALETMASPPDELELLHFLTDGAGTHTVDELAHHR